MKCQHQSAPWYRHPCELWERVVSERGVGEGPLFGYFEPETGNCCAAARHQPDGGGFVAFEGPGTQGAYRVGYGDPLADGTGLPGVSVGHKIVGGKSWKMLHHTVSIKDWPC